MSRPFHHRAQHKTLFLLIALLAVVLVPPHPIALTSMVEPESPPLTHDNDDAERLVASRESLGLSTDPALVDTLLADANAPTNNYGMPLADHEVRELEARDAFVDAIHDRVSATLDNIADYAGLYFDFADSGDAYLLVTEDVRGAREAIGEISISQELHNLVIEKVDHDLPSLKEAMRRTWELWDSHAPDDLELHEVTVDIRRNGIMARASGDHEALRNSATLQDLSDAVGGIAIRVEEGQRPVDECAGRESCSDELRPGAIMRRGGTSGPRCTVGWHVIVGGQVDLVSAGHCSYSSSKSNHWYHYALNPSYVGSVKSNFYNSVEQFDLMNVSIADTRASNHAMGTIVTPNSARNPYQGETICASLGRTDNVTCGSVQDAYTSWQGSNCSCTMYGARHSGISTMGGDSGSPIWATSGNYAVGIHASSTGGFSRMGQAMNWLYSSGMHQ